MPASPCVPASCTPRNASTAHNISSPSTQANGIATTRLLPVELQVTSAVIHHDTRQQHAERRIDRLPINRVRRCGTLEIIKPG